MAPADSPKHRQDDCELQYLAKTSENVASLIEVSLDHLGSVTYKVNDQLDEKVDEVSGTEFRVSCIEQLQKRGLIPEQNQGHHHHHLGSGHCSSPGSGHNSGHNSMGGDMSGQLLWQPSRGSPEYSPIPSPRMTSPGPSSRIHSGAVTPLHPIAGGAATDDGKQQSHWLPLPPVTISNSSPYSHSNSAATSPSLVATSSC